jgi:hypothetical protein
VAVIFPVVLCGYELLFCTLKKEQELHVFENIQWKKDVARQ